MPVTKKITVSTIKGLRIEDRRINDTEIHGFHARISLQGKVKYYFYYRVDGKQRNYLIGSGSVLSPNQARDRAKEVAGLVASGVEVHIDKRQLKTAKTIKLTLGTYLEETYLPYLESLNPKTSRHAYRVITSSFKSLLKKPLAEVNAWDIQKWVTERRKLGRSPATISYAVNRLKSAFNRAVEWEWIESHNLKKVKLVREENTRVRYLSETEERTLMRSLRNRDEQIRAQRRSGNRHRQERSQRLYPTFDNVRFVDYLEPLVITAINTGLRRGELLALKWDDVDFEQQYLSVRAQNAKAKKSRNIPLNDTVLEVLESWQLQNKKREYVFASRSDIPIKDIKKPWLRVLQEAKITDFRFHDLRHHFASKLVMVGVDLNTVRELLGHSDLKMTLRYAHLAPEHKAAAVSLIG
ncbi:site-specific integrase [Vibrio europaeus]|uniref:Integrase n=1 Tax=Vibrio europaeus TaxID=300876 RepID=A0A178JHE8_9VIBR|nr:site-specific integrase [Vibrio europaeus]MDC5704581.1 site-specific integrase [Vibrio europaeus]MDC5712067.1 site-specific integrase [Vibrio europaeus]MDC5717795.1 site-specific integrase [Vibrio europaeus]MDC5727704.1 site-specific integrase [Vibrio europaeus]MDC5731913.1 site-specific integrase [Vibrio europaeus]